MIFLSLPASAELTAATGKIQPEAQAGIELSKLLFPSLLAPVEVEDEAEVPIHRAMPPLPLPADAMIHQESTLVTSPAVAAGDALSSLAAELASFPALAFTGSLPPDSTGAIGPNHLLSAVNGRLLVQRRDGTELGTATLQDFFGGLGACMQVFDPRVVYDGTTQRWFVVAGCDPQQMTSAVLMATSRSSDPTAGWWLTRWRADPSGVYFADQPNVGFNATWLVFQINMFPLSGSGGEYSKIFAIPKSSLLAGGSVTASYFTLPGNLGFSQVPAITHDNNSTQYLFQTWNGNAGGAGYVRLYWITGAIGSEYLTYGDFFSTSSPWQDFAPALNPAPQLGSSIGINTGDSRMQSVVLRNGVLWATHTVYLPGLSAAQWWSVDPVSKSYSVGRVLDSSGAHSVAFPSLAPNRNNDVLLAYALFSGSLYATSGFNLRLASEPGAGFQPQWLLKGGEGSYVRMDSFGRNRWGDYSAAWVDPSNGTDLWTLQEYSAAGNVWGTWWTKIKPVERPPVFDPLSSQTVAEGQLLSFRVHATDADGDPLTYSARNLPRGAVFDPAQQQLSWPPDYTQAGSYTVTFAATDGLATATAAVTITVANTNRAPVIASVGNRTLRQGESVSFTISATDADGDPLTFDASGLPTGSTFDRTTHVFSWSPATLAGTFTVTFTVSDGMATSSIQVTLDVRVNRPPVFTTPSDVTGSEGAPLTFVVQVSDPDGDPLTIAETGVPPGAVYDRGTGSFSWSPDFTQAGIYTVAFTASDGVLSAEATVRIAIRNTNRPPVLSAIPDQTVRQREKVTLMVEGADPDGDAITFSATGLPPAAVFDPLTRAFSWQTSTELGAYPVTFHASDGALDTAVQVTLTVRTNRAPQLAAVPPQSTLEGDLLSFKVTATDVDDDPLSFGVSELPPGSSFDGRTGLFSWTPGYDKAGSYTLTITVSDGLLSDSTQVALQVLNNNRPPKFASLSARTATVGQRLSLALTASDPDGDPLTYTPESLPEGAEFDVRTSRFTWTPSDGDLGLNEAVFRVSDGQLEDRTMLSIQVVRGCGCGTTGNSELAALLAGVVALIGWRRRIVR